MKKKLPLVIYLTGSSWCSQCNIFTREYIKKQISKCRREKFIFWLVDTKQAPGNSPGTFNFKMVPEEAAKSWGVRILPVRRMWFLVLPLCLSLTLFPEN